MSAYGAVLVDQLERLLPAPVRVDEGRDDRAEELVPEEAEVGILGPDDGRLDEIALAVVVAAADDDLALGVGLRLLDRLLLRVERGGVDDRAHEVREVGDVAVLELADLRDELLLDRRPHALGCVDARGGRALLALVLEGAAQDRSRDGLGVRGRVRDDEVLAAGLADDARVAAIAGDVLADRLPHALEDRRRAGEVDAGEVGLASAASPMSLPEP